jgi:BirA family biotin operon repressor/biotin-[acetyl-CoA-carboxylase] ligase
VTTDGHPPAIATPIAIERFENIPSTSDLAKKRAEDGAPSWTAIVASSQSAGRGQHQRHWVSPPGNLYCSVILRPETSPAESAELSFVSALAASDVLSELLPESDVRLKWPNDVLISGKKIAGLLLEAGPAEPNGLVPWIVIGLGLNISSYPEDIEYPVTSIHAERKGSYPSPATLLSEYLDALSLRLAEWREAGFSAIRTAWLIRAYGLGDTATVHHADGDIRGIFIDIDENGGFILEMEEGKRRTITGGAIYFDSGPGSGDQTHTSIGR